MPSEIKTPGMHNARAEITVINVIGIELVSYLGLTEKV